MARIQYKTDVDIGTGEILSRQEKIIPDYFNPDNGYRLFARSKSVRTMPIVDFPKELSRIDMGHLLFLTRSMWANTGCIGLLKARKFKPYNDVELYNYIGFTFDRKGREWLKKMVKLSMLRSIDINLPNGSQERQWYINPVYFCPMFINRQTYLIWKDQIEKFVPDYVKRLLD